MAETPTLTLTDFLLARIAEDEASAIPATCFCGWCDDMEDERWHPANARCSRRVLAECEAKRRIVAEHWDCSGACGCCGTTSGESDIFAYEVPWPCPTLRFLATVYADHPDYREEWHA